METDEMETDKTETQEEKVAVETTTLGDDAEHPAGHFVWSAALGALTIWPWGAVLMTLPHRKALAEQKTEWKYCGHMALITFFTWGSMIGSKHWVLDKIYGPTWPYSSYGPTEPYSSLPVDNAVTATLCRRR